MFTKHHNDVYAAIDPTLERVSAKGKFIVITGGSGIGPHIAEAFAKAGAAKITLLGRTERTLLSTKQSLESEYPAQVSIHNADVGQEAAVDKSFKELGRLGRTDVLISNAGYLADKFSIADSNITDCWAAYEVNVKAAVLITRVLLNCVAEEVVLINISAGLAHVHPIHRHSAYSTSKIATAKIYEYFQLENPDLRVFNLHPGVIPTDMGKKSTTGKGMSSTMLVDTHQLPAHFCVWLASPEAAFLKGKFL